MKRNLVVNVALKWANLEGIGEEPQRHNKTGTENGHQHTNNTHPIATVTPN